MFIRKNTTPPKTHKRSSYIDTGAVRRAAKAAGRAADKAGTGLFRWMVTNHTNNLASLLIDEPTSGFWAGVWYQLKVLLLTIGIVIVRVLLIVILYTLMFWFLYYFLTH